jgi:hypothetical protein
MSQEYRGWVPKFSNKKNVGIRTPDFRKKKKIFHQTFRKVPKFPNQPHENREKPTM